MSRCTLYSGPLNRQGYGILRRGGEQLAHRVFYAERYGPIPKGAQCLHVCDRPGCVETAHLYLGTNADNVRDRQEKGRHARGTRHGMAKLSDEQVVIVRTLLAQGVPQASLVGLLGVSKTLISLIANGKRRQPATGGTS